ncbi:C4-type zinc ribbon domain-containing protein [Brevibacillus sp. SYSU BS000544]|uniref:C4-type zinc ribbon domain-containing protein n=1 Tax=Brevibacillus sp. SYSU BS000544 TaxID=3416443 RepID=UPI003CE5419B
MLSVRNLLEWHQTKESIQQAKNERDNLDKERKKRLTSIQELRQRIEALPITDNPEEQIQKLLAEQELWMANKDFEQFESDCLPKLASLDNSISEKSFELMRLESEVDEALFSEYYRLAENKKNPIVEVKRKICTGCYYPLSLAKVDEWRRAKGLVYCDECGRILV